LREGVSRHTICRSPAVAVRPIAMIGSAGSAGLGGVDGFWRSWQHLPALRAAVSAVTEQRLFELIGSTVAMTGDPRDRIRCLETSSRNKLPRQYNLAGFWRCRQCCPPQINPRLTTKNVQEEQIMASSIWSFDKSLHKQEYVPKTVTRDMKGSDTSVALPVISSSKVLTRQSIVIFSDPPQQKKELPACYS
jgi:hypothetical protein